MRSYIIKKYIAYVERVPTLWTYAVACNLRFGDRTMPVLMRPNREWIADSTIIVDRLEASNPGNLIEPKDPFHTFFALLAGAWASEFWHPVAATRNPPARSLRPFRATCAGHPAQTPGLALQVM